MSDIQFEDSTNNHDHTRLLYSRLEPSSNTPGIVKALLKSKIVKTESQALFLITFIVIVCIVGSIMIIRRSSATNATVDPLPNDPYQGLPR